MSKIVVIGDMMQDVDEFTVYHKRHEGMPVVQRVNIVERGGGALSVMSMLAALGARAQCFGLGRSLKHRVYVGDKLTMRIDRDESRNPSIKEVADWMNAISHFWPDLVLICDHAKGVVCDLVMSNIYQLGIPVLVDPCSNSNWSLFERASCISANRSEWSSMPKGFSPAEDMIKIMRMDKNGIGWWDKQQNFKQAPSICKDVVDTVGAGDQFMAVLACMRARGESWDASISLANTAAGLQCEKNGIVPVTWDEIHQRLPAGVWVSD